MNLNNIVIVLDHPDEARNIGAACRAMANSDIKELRIVGNKADYDIQKVHTLAIHAAYIFDNAKFYNDINEATADCTLSAGTTRRRGKKRGILMLPEEFAQEAGRITGAVGDVTEVNGCEELVNQPAAAVNSREDLANQIETPVNSRENFVAQPKAPVNARGGKVAVVFGNERTGLTDPQLDMCTVGVTIPTSDDFGSLNLSHAVQIICYHLFRHNKGEIKGYTPLELSRLDKTVTTIADSLQKVGFFKITGRPDMENFWRSVLARAALSESEAQYMEKTFTKMAGLIEKNK